MKFNAIIDEKNRIDVYLKDYFNLPRTKICKFIKENGVSINGNKIFKCNFILSLEEYNFEINDLIYDLNNTKKKISKLNKKLDVSKIKIVYENDDFAIIEKPDNLSMYRVENTKNSEETLADYLSLMFKNLPKFDDNRFGIVHRLDKNTTGLVIIAKTKDFLISIKKQFKEKTVIKKYVGIVSPPLKHNSAKIDLPISRNLTNRKLMNISEENGKEAITFYKVLETKENRQLVEFKIITGRTHQIRVHMKYLKSPIYNDPEYGKKVTNERNGQFLHSYFLSFKDQHGEKYEFKSNNVFKFN